jgi:flagellar hook-length control protein FliK
MDAKLNPVSSQLPDFSSHGDTVKKDTDGPSFRAAFKTAQKKEASEPRKIVAKDERPIRTEEKIPSSQREPAAPVQARSVQAAETQSVRTVSENDGPKEFPSDDNTEVTPAKKNMASKNVIVDDKKGIVAKSYDGMVVSYPVSRIAKESLDEKTLKFLDDQGLSNLPTLVMAQPSQSFSAMQNVTEESAIPVPKPIAQFMASLENELGVKPDRLVQAFKKLPAGQLTLPPSIAMAQVVKNLNLNPADQAKASELFTKMLAQMEKAQNELMTPMMIPATGAGVVAVKTAEKTEENGIVTKNKTQAAVARYAQNTGDSAQKGVETEKTPFTLGKEVTAKEAVVSPQGKEAVLTKDSASSGQNQDLYSQKLVPKEMTAVTQQPASEAQAQILSAPQGQAAMASPVVANEIKDEKAVSKESKLDSKMDVKHVSTQSATSSPVSTQVDATPAKPGMIGQPLEVAGGGAAGEMKASSDNKHEAIRSIINNAQMLAAKGGGVMRMTLKPDHLGEIQLKVAMEGNRVNVQMTAERGEVKKLIEQNVHELRHGLASHNLSMDKLDVTLSNRDAGAFTKGQPDFGAARDFAQQFHQNQSNKREFMEGLSGLRTNAQKTMNTIDRATQSQGARNSGSRSGRLNIVA